jgi:putative holliday junction resolvase
LHTSGWSGDETATTGGRIPRARVSARRVATSRVTARRVTSTWVSARRVPATRVPATGAGVRPGVRLGIDVGKVRIGVARSDPGALLASPLETVLRGSGDLARLAALVSENEAVEVVVGLAVGLAGQEGKAAADGRTFATALAGLLAPVPVRLVDERFTTVLAHAALQQGGLRSRGRRQVVDKAAAALLLQGALDAERSTGEPAGQLVAAGGAKT